MPTNLRNSLIVLLALAYLTVLVMSAGHLTKWFDLSLGSLPPYFSIGLAVGLELLAFTLSLASTLEPRLRYAFWGGAFFLLLVWFGNLMAMLRVADAPGWEVLAQSLFALGPLVAGKAIGELLRLDARPNPVEPTDRRPTADRSTPPPAVHLETHVHSTTVHQSIQAGTTHSAERFSLDTPVEQSAPAWNKPVPLDDRAEQLLAALSADRPLGPSALARQTGLPKTTVYRLAARLVEAGLVVQTADGLVRKEAPVEP
uniref:MarR family transcriptional regulator n=1 Tax=Meiothermus ruber TaxID=277 RepID=A0A7C3DHR9_MEIRU